MADVVAMVEVERDEPPAAWQQVLSDLKAEAERRMGRRKDIETRWLEDLAQYHGQYDADTYERLKMAKKSRVFMNRTRPKTDSLAARLEDMLFPTDDRNWGIEPTPWPELSAEAEAAAAALQDAQEQQALAAGQGADEAELAARAQAVQAAQGRSDGVQATIAEAEKRARLMERRIEDILVESTYHAEMRDLIMDACKIGCGVAKSPVLEAARRGKWAQTAPGVYEMRPEAASARVRYVDPWCFYPDPDARSIRDSRGVFELSLVSKAEARRWAGRGYDAGAIRRILRSEPSPGATPSYLAQLRAISATKTGHHGGEQTGYYRFWCYSGPLEPEQVLALYEAAEDDAGIADVQAAIEVDELADLWVVLWFCDDELLRVGPYPMDSGEPLYSVYSVFPDEATVLGGYGVPRLMRHEQSALNAAWRKLLDNAGVAGHQIAIEKGTVRPVNGEWRIEGDKIWEIEQGAVASGRRPIEVFPIPPNLQHMASIIDLCERQIDQVTSMPLIAQGEQGTGVTRTAQGMSLLMTSANVTFRRLVRMFDDDVTTPIIRRLYDWEMQSPDCPPECKGDYQVHARGAGVLLEREVRAAAYGKLFEIAHSPVFGPLMKPAELLRNGVRANMVEADAVVKSDEEIAEDQRAAAEMAQQNPEMAYRMKELETRVAIAEADRDARLQVAQIGQETTMYRAAEAANMTMEQVRQRAADAQAERESKERKIAAEIGMAQRSGVHSGGAV